MINEQFGWLWIGMGFLSGGWIGLNFSREDWLGGYGTYRRRLVRLGHISFLGLGFANILFAHSMERVGFDTRLASTIASSASNAGWMTVASWGFVIGGITMPLCCGLTAWRPGFKPLFGVPVTALLTAAILTAVGIARQGVSS